MFMVNGLLLLIRHLHKEDYGDSPIRFIERMGLSKEEWQKNSKSTLLRAAIMTPYLNDDRIFQFLYKRNR